MIPFLLSTFQILVIYSGLNPIKAPLREVDPEIRVVVQKLLDEISLKPGEKMDTLAIRQLFHPKASIAVLNPSDQHLELVSLNEFLAFLTDASYEEGFSEWELKSEVRQMQDIATIWQAFKGASANGEEAQGINSCQLVKQEGHWLILNLLWTFEAKSPWQDSFPDSE